MPVHSRALPNAAARNSVVPEGPSASDAPMPMPRPSGTPTPLVPRADDAPWPRGEESYEPTGLPWYRTEPWLAAMLACLAPLSVAFFAPDAAKLPLIGVGMVLLIAGVVLLLRQGLYAPRRIPEAKRRTEGRAAGGRARTQHAGDAA